MKLKKEYIILIVIIIALSGYLYLRQTDSVHYQVPELGGIDTKEVTRIEIASTGTVLTLTKKDESWFIAPEEWPADTAKVENMLTVFKDLTITDLVSESKNYLRYELDDENKISVKAYAGETVIREFAAGKTAPTNRHTFVMLPGDDKVYQANGDFRKKFETTAADLRDRRVLAFTKDEIRTVRIASAGKDITLTREEVAGEAAPGQAEGAPKTIQWKDAGGTIVENARVDKLLGSLNSLDCEDYLQDRTIPELGSAETQIVLTAEKDYSLSLYKKEADRRPASSSGSSYVFSLPESRLEGIEQALAGLTDTPVAK